MERRSFLTAAGAFALPTILRSHGAKAATSRVRRNASTMLATDEFFSDYAKAVAAMHQLPVDHPHSWRTQARIHIKYCKHGGAGFTHWHRWYLSYFEQICAKLINKDSFSLAYWDWEGSRSNIPSPLFDVANLNVESLNDESNFQSDSWGPVPVTTVGKRGLKNDEKMTSIPQYSRAFLKSTIDGIRSQSSFSIFTGLLEGSPHNTAHVASGSYRGANGHMGDGLSSLDPLFWLHHCNIDRIWAEWQASGNKTDDPKQSYADNFYRSDEKLDDKATSTAAIELKNFDYNYDTLTSAALAAVAKEFDIGELKQNRPNIFSNLKLTSPTTIAKAGGGGRASVNVETAINISVPGLLKVISDARTFQAPHGFGLPRRAVEPRRIIARIEGVRPAAVRNLVIGVFVNCPYLSPDTPSDDKHCAGIYSFFGSHGVHAGHNPEMDIYVDLTGSVRTLAGEGRIGGNALRVQLMTVAPGGDAPASTFIAFRSVTLLST